MRSVLILALAMVVLGCAAEATETASTAQNTDSSRLGGKVLETIDVSTYTYVRFETPYGEAWAAVPQAPVEIGSEIVIANPQAMSNFESKTLGRSFETIYFGTIEGRNVASPMAPSTAKGRPSTAPIDVARAEGAIGRTIAELYAEKGEFSGKSVALRGKVVKYSAGIMGRNWIHLQDGTGDSSAGTNDITVTSSDTTAVGETILVEGIVSVDKDFGAGYSYAVIVEQASVK